MLVQELSLVVLALPVEVDLVVQDSVDPMAMVVVEREDVLVPVVADPHLVMLVLVGLVMVDQVVDTEDLGQNVLVTLVTVATHAPVGMGNSVQIVQVVLVTRVVQAVQVDLAVSGRIKTKTPNLS